MAGAILDMVGKTLGDLLIERIKFLIGLSDEVEKIQSKLEEMQNFLTVPDNKKVHEFLHLAYECENVLELHAFKIESWKGWECEKVLQRLANILFEIINRQKIGPQLVNIRDKLSNIVASFEGSQRNIPIQFQGQSSNAGMHHKYRQTYPHKEVEPFVGMERELKELIRLMKIEDVPVISILGVGGIGKTALARKVYNHFKKQGTRRFEAFASVTITQECHYTSTMEKILSQLGTKSDITLTGKGETDLVPRLFEELTQRKCLVFLDDIWSVQQWNDFNEAFPSSSDAKSVILLTTRREEVAKKGFICKPSYFSEEESWELFQKKAFLQTVDAQGSQDPYIQKKESLGREIVAKCKNLPLAISKIGEILKGKGDVGDWEDVKRNIDTYLKGREGTEPHEAVLHILGLSYEDMPYQLKLCFLYMGIFPEGAEIDAETLYFMWIAEGLVSPRQKNQGINETLLDIAEQRLKEMANRSLVEVRMKALPGSRKLFESCRLRGLMQDLCLQKCREDEFLKVMELGSSEPQKGDPRYGTKKAYRLAIYNDAIKDQDSFIKKIAQESTERVRCISLHMENIRPTDMKQGKCHYLGNFSYLRILHLSGFGLEKKSMHKVLRKLIHLRFLSLKSCVLHELPSSVADLPFLEALDLRLSNKIIVPNVLCKIQRLKHLFLGRLVSASEREKLRLNGLSSLETLEGFQPQYMKVEDVYTLTNLRFLSSEVGDNTTLPSIIHLFHQAKEKCAKICDTKLVVDGCDFITMPEFGSDLLRMIFACPGLNRVRISGPLGDLYKSIEKGRESLGPNLNELELTGKTAFDNDSWAALECLENLQRLVLRSASFVKVRGQSMSEMVSHKQSFPSLLSFELIACDMNQWRIEKGAMPNLSSLVINGCSKLETIPKGLRFLRKIKILTVCHMPPYFNESIDRDVPLIFVKAFVEGSCHVYHIIATQNQVQEVFNIDLPPEAEPSPASGPPPFRVEEQKNWIMSLLERPFHKVARYLDLPDVQIPLQILSRYPSVLTKKQAMVVEELKSRIGDDPSKWQKWKELSTELDDAEKKAKEAEDKAQTLRSELAPFPDDWKDFGRIMRTEVAMKLVPDKKKFLEVMGNSGNIHDDMEKFCRTFSPLFGETHKFLVGVGLDSVKASLWNQYFGVSLLLIHFCCSALFLFLKQSSHSRSLVSIDRPCINIFTSKN